LLNFSVLAALGLFQPSLNLRRLFAILLLGIYGFYAYVVLRLERSEETVIEHRLYLETLLGGDSAEPRAAITALQVVLAVGMILAGASLFVEQVILLSRHLGVDPGVVSLILSPLATELPEKYNSVVWIRQSKDHLALANITGAMVFQACIPGALGLAFTPWHLTPAQWVACAVAVVSAAILYLNVRRGYLKTPAMMFGGVAYLVFIGGLWMVGAI
jgi:cation:H+ antiporter